MSFDEMYDELLHAEFLPDAVHDPAHQGADAAAGAIFGTSRFRSIALITSGGLAFAALGAFLGGLGSNFAVSPAAAHPLTTSHRSVPLAAASAPVNRSFRAGTLAPTVVPAGSGAVTPSTTNDNSPVGAASAPVTTIVGDRGGAPRPASVTGGIPIPTVPLPIAAPPPVTQLGLSGAVAGLGQTVTGIASSVPGPSSVPAPSSGLAAVTTPLTGVVNDVTSSLAGTGGSGGGGAAPSCVSTPALPIPTGGGLGLPIGPVAVSVCVTP
jgi:hypothetical protein